MESMHCGRFTLEDGLAYGEKVKSLLNRGMDYDDATGEGYFNQAIYNSLYLSFFVEQLQLLNKDFTPEEKHQVRQIIMETLTLFNLSIDYLGQRGIKRHHRKYKFNKDNYMAKIKEHRFNLKMLNKAFKHAYRSSAFTMMADDDNEPRIFTSAKEFIYATTDIMTSLIRMLNNKTFNYLSPLKMAIISDYIFNYSQASYRVITKLTKTINQRSK